MHLDTTRTLYVCIDSANGTLKLLLPRHLLSQLDVEELRLDNPDPASTDAAEARLLEAEMEELRFDL